MGTTGDEYLYLYSGQIIINAVIRKPTSLLQVVHSILTLIAFYFLHSFGSGIVYAQVCAVAQQYNIQKVTCLRLLTKQL